MDKEAAKGGKDEETKVRRRGREPRVKEKGR